MNVNRLNVVSAGMVTSVGMDAPSSAAAIRAGLDNFQLSEFRDTTNEPIVVAPVKITSIETATEYRQGGYEHFSRMCTLAIEECAIKAGLSLPLPTDIAIFILGDDTRPKPITTIIHTLLHDDSLFHQSEQRHIQAFTHGESSCIYALAAANSYLTNNSYAILLAADSWLNTPDIESNLHWNRINTSESAGGFIPGEAAAACLLTRTIPHAHQLSVLGLACAEEQASLLSDQPVYGVGLAAAMKAAIQQAGISPEKIDLRVSDLSGEQYFFEEAAYAWARTLREPSPADFSHQTIAAHIGHTGCSFGPVLIAYLWQLMFINRLNAEYILMHLSSAQTSRGAAVFTPQCPVKEKI